MDDLDLDDLDLEAELAAVKQEEAEKEQQKAKEEQEAEEDPVSEPAPDEAAPVPEETPVAPSTPSAADGAPRPTSSRLSRPGTSAKVHPAPAQSPTPPPPPSEHDLEKGVTADDQATDEAPDWADKWLSAHNKTAKLNAFQQYIQRVQDQGEGPVACPTAEERHATAYWVTRRFLLDRFSAHGVPHIVRHPGRCRRLLWVIIVLVAVAALVFQVRATLTEFLEYPKKVTIEVLEEKEPDFPAVTICNFNVLNSEKMKEVDKYKDIVLLEEELRKNQFDCELYKKDFDGFYETNDVYDLYDYMWIDDNEDEGGSEVEHEGTTSTNLETIETTNAETGSTGSTDVTDTTDGIEPTFYEVTTVSKTGPGETDETAANNADSTGATNSADSTTDSGADIPTEPDVTEISLRRKREASVTASKPAAPSNGTDEPPEGAVRPSTSHDALRAGAGRPDRPRAQTGGRRLQSVSDSSAGTGGGRRGRRLVRRSRRRRSADWSGNSFAGEEEIDWYDAMSFSDVPENYTQTFYDPACKCEMTCDLVGCYQSDSIFDKLGSASTFRDLLQSLAYSSADPAVMQRAFTPSVDDIQKYGIKSAQFITSCSLDNNKCSHSDFLQWQSDSYGNCYTFNSGFRYEWKDNAWVHIKPNKTRTYGSKTGLRVTLNVDATHYASLLTPDVGVRVLVHPVDQMPFPEERGFSVVPGFTTAVSISRKKIRRIGKPHGNCRNHTGWTQHLDIRYTTTACQKRCVEEAIRTKCGCMESVNRALTIGLARNMQRCNPLTDAVADRCRQQVKSRFISGKDTCDCPPACLEDRFEKSLSMNLPNKIYYKIMRNFTDGFTGADLCDSDGVSNSTIRLQVFLEDLSYEYIHESPAYSLEALISNIGGVMGLCLGLSALTLVEMIEYLLELLAGGWRNCRNRKDRAATRSGIRKVEVLPADQKTGMQCVTIIHTFERPPPHIVQLPPPPKPPQTESEAQTKVSLTFLGKKKRPTKKAPAKTAAKRR